MAYITCQVLNVDREKDRVKVRLLALVRKREITGVICKEWDSFLFKLNGGHQWHLISGYLPDSQKLSEFYSDDEAFVEEGQSLYEFSKKNVSLKTLKDINPSIYINVEK